jgi:predicted Zn finger-like uncharacterized protein
MGAAVQIACPSCQTQLRIPDAVAGKKFKCPKCNAIIQGNTLAEHIQAQPPIIREVPPAPTPPPLPREDDEKDLSPRSARRQDQDSDAQDTAESFRQRLRRREFDEDDFGDIRDTRSDAVRRVNSASVWFLLAGIATMVLLIINIGSTLYVRVRLDNAGMMEARDAARVAGRTVGLIGGLIGCGVVGLIGVVFQFMASASLRSFTGKGKIITAIVFAFIFGVAFGIGLIVNLTVVARVPSGAFQIVVFVTMILGATTTFFNFFAAIKGIITLNNPAVGWEFRR